MKNVQIFLLIYWFKLKHFRFITLPTSLVYAQAYHETGGFKSPIFKENKNLFGMKVNSRKFDKGENRGHAVYYSLSDSIKDYFARQIQFKISFDSPESYIKETFDSNYAEDGNYMVAWFNTYERFKWLSFLTYFLVPTIVVLYYYLQKKSFFF